MTPELLLEPPCHAAIDVFDSKGAGVEFDVFKDFRIVAAFDRIPAFGSEKM